MHWRSRVKKFVRPIADHLTYGSQAYVDIKSTLNQLVPSLMDFRGRPGGDADERLLEFLRYLRPMTWDGKELRRVGGDGDGGYVMSTPVVGDGAISVGIGRDVSWDIDVAQRGVPVAMFDPTIRRLPRSVAGGRFFRVGLASSNHGTKYKPLSGLVSLAGMDSNSDLLLKVDVEGAEWLSLEGVLQDELQSFRQIVIELHGISQLRNLRESERLLTGIHKLTRYHWPVHIHANNYGGLSLYDSFWFPEVIEVSLVRKDHSNNFVPALTLASELDAPCDPRVHEIRLDSILRIPFS